MPLSHQHQQTVGSWLKAHVKTCPSCGASSWIVGEPVGLLGLTYHAINTTHVAMYAVVVHCQGCALVQLYSLDAMGVHLDPYNKP
jgi:hypothetical protein